MAVKDEEPYPCWSFEEGSRLPECMVLYYQDDNPEYSIQDEVEANGWCQVTITCRLCGMSETWVEEA